MLIRIAVVVGEPSGDLLGARLATILKKIHPSIEIEGVIGSEMINAGCLQLHSMNVLSVMGLIEPIKRLPKILALRKWLLRYLLENPPDLFIGIDAPDFNLNLAKTLHKAGIPTVHYVSPSVWARRQGRIKNIKQSIDLMLTLFPFEEQFYKEHAVPVCYTGHPTADLVDLEIDTVKAKELLGYEAQDIVLAVMPGSRNSEMKSMVRIYLETIKLCHQANPTLKFVMPLLYAGHEAYVEYWRQKIIPEIEIKVVVGDSYAVMRAVDFALVTSGTATLEVMLHKKPMVVAYKTNWFTYQVVKLLIQIKSIALPNILANQKIVPEFIQQAAKPSNIATALLELINSSTAQALQVTEFHKLHKILRQDASNKAANAINEMLKKNSKEDTHVNSWSG